MATLLGFFVHSPASLVALTLAARLTSGGIHGRTRYQRIAPLRRRVRHA